MLYVISIITRAITNAQTHTAFSIGLILIIQMHFYVGSTSVSTIILYYNPFVFYILKYNTDCVIVFLSIAKVSVNSIWL